MSSAAQPRERAGYRLISGERVLIAQRINGRVALADVPAGDEGRVFLGRRHVESRAELDGLVAGHVADSLRRGERAALLPAAPRFHARD